LIVSRFQLTSCAVQAPAVSRWRCPGSLQRELACQSPQEICSTSNFDMEGERRSCGAKVQLIGKSYYADSQKRSQRKGHLRAVSNSRHDCSRISARQESEQGTCGEQRRNGRSKCMQSGTVHIKAGGRHLNAG
jgi:hypothetical protein